MINDPRLTQAISWQPYPLLFLTISGAHLYGFPSPDSDYDIRGVHILPAPDAVGLDSYDETLERSAVIDGLEIDAVTHDARKFFHLLLKRNGYVLEQIYSPLIVVTTPEHDELKRIAKGCITRHHSHHYLGFAENQWRLFDKERGIKQLLYTYRVLLTGIYLMQTGEVEANVVRLNDVYRLPYIADLVAHKQTGTEKSVLVGADRQFHRSEFERLRRLLEEACAVTHLPEVPTTREDLNALLVRLRLGQRLAV